MAVCIGAVTHCCFGEKLLYPKVHCEMNYHCLCSIKCNGSPLLHAPICCFLRQEDTVVEKRHLQNNIGHKHRSYHVEPRNSLDDVENCCWIEFKETAEERTWLPNYFTDENCIEHGTNILFFLLFQESRSIVHILCSTGRPTVNHYPHSCALAVLQWSRKHPRLKMSSKSTQVESDPHLQRQELFYLPEEFFIG